MTTDNLLTAIAGVLVALPGTVALVPDLRVSPEFQAALLILALVGAAILKQSRPAGSKDGELSDADVRRIAAQQERIRMGLVRQEQNRRVSGG